MLNKIFSDHLLLVNCSGVINKVILYTPATDHVAFSCEYPAGEKIDELIRTVDHWRYGGGFAYEEKKATVIWMRATDNVDVDLIEYARSSGWKCVVMESMLMGVGKDLAGYCGMGDVNEEVLGVIRRVMYEGRV